MKFFGKHNEGKKILFVCVENAGRSQIAEGFFRKYAPKGWTTISAGSRPTPEINPVAVDVMKEVGIDISKQKPKELSEELIRSSFIKVSMGCMEQTECPAVFLGNHQDWGIEDPKGKPIEKVREIRDEIEKKVKELATNLELS
ncbi:Arsenate reductase [Nitrosotalea devaniterrae]|uniref:Arsenate reductase n=1 Tax=Nitrosotalea devaniterrae TaxID=1078905 RepID=A0A128A192_9ARCH|nr:Arsenate reductase [Candidatus Nitrosotalea devanaterra]